MRGIQPGEASLALIPWVLGCASSLTPLMVEPPLEASFPPAEQSEHPARGTADHRTAPTGELLPQPAPIEISLKKERSSEQK